VDVERIFDRLVPTCTTVNEVNRVLIALDNRMTPREADRLIRHVTRLERRSRLRRRIRRALPGGAPVGFDPLTPAAEWAAKAGRQLSHGTPPDQVPVRGVAVRRGAVLYQAGARPADVLVVGFTGHMRRMMLPTPVFLQQIAPLGADVLLLAARGRSGFRSGVAGHSTDLPSTVRWLEGVIAEHGATTVVAVGTSAGAFPSVLAGHALGLPAVLAAGTRVGTAASYWPGSAGEAVSDVVTASTRAGAAPAVHLVYGADSAADVADAATVAGAVPRAVLHPVEDAGHSCLFPLVVRGELPGLLAETVPSPRDHG
jgi:hypothetical protein